MDHWTLDKNVMFVKLFVRLEKQIFVFDVEFSK